MNGGASTTDLTATGNTVLGSATTTALFAATASTTNFFGAGLTLCQSGNVLTWTSGRFGCAADATGADGVWPFSTGVSYGGQVTQSTSTLLWLRGAPLSLAASSSVLTYASSSAISAQSLFSEVASTSQLLVSGFGTSTFSGGIETRVLNITGSATSTAQNGFNITSGCFSINGTCIGQGAAAASIWPFDTAYYNGTLAQSTTTSIWLKGTSIIATSTFFTYASTTQLTVSGGAYFPGSGIWNASGSVGIGSSTPSQLLTVAGTSSLRDLIPEGPYTNNLSAYSIGDTTHRWSSMWTGALNIGTSTFSLKSDSASNLGFFTAAQGDGTQALTLTSAGTVGIGTTSPATLSIQAAANATPLNIASSSGAYMLSLDTTGALTAKLKQLTADYAVSSTSESISAGDIVALFNGEARQASANTGTPAALNSVSSLYESAAALNSTHFVVAYQNVSTTYAEAVVCSISGTAISCGTPTALNSVASTYTSAAALNSTHFVVAYKGTSNYANAVVSSVSGTTITPGTPVALNSVASTYTSAAALNSTHFVVAYGGTSNYANAVVSSVSGTTITPGTPAALNSVSSLYISAAALNSTHFVAAYYNSGDAKTRAVVSSVSGTTISPGTPTIIVNAGSSYISAAALNSTHFVVAYANISTNDANAVVSSVSGTTITPGTPTALNSVNSYLRIRRRPQLHPLRRRV